MERRPLIAGLAQLTHRLLRQELILLLLGLAVVGGAWGFIELTDEVLEGESRQVDRWVVQALRDPHNPADPLGPPWLEQAAVDVTALGSVAVLVLVVAAVTVFLLLVRRYDRLLLVLAASGGGWLLMWTLKSLIARPRPSLVPHLTSVMTLSFPSGHAMSSAVIYLTLGALLAQMVRRWRLRIYFLCVAMAATGLVGLTRVYLGVHYPSDVLAGWAAGLAWAAGVWVVADLLGRRRERGVTR